MPKSATTDFVVDHSFDPRSCRHSLNGLTHVLHCHHYASLYSQLADDCEFLDAKQLLADCSEDSFYEVLSNYYRENRVKGQDERFAIAQQYYSHSGLGQLNVVNADKNGGQIELPHSHVDEGWVKKWSNHDKPVNFITWGYISAMFSAVFDRPVRSYKVTEDASIVRGADRSRFSVTSK